MREGETEKQNRQRDEERHTQSGRTLKPLPDPCTHTHAHTHRLAGAGDDRIRIARVDDRGAHIAHRGRRLPIDHRGGRTQRGDRGCDDEHQRRAARQAARAPTPLRFGSGQQERCGPRVGGGGAVGRG